MVDGMHTFWLKKEDSKELYSKCRISGIVGNVRIYENSLIIQKYFRTPLKRSKKFSYPMKRLQNILVPPPLFDSAPIPCIKNDRSLNKTQTFCNSCDEPWDIFEIVSILRHLSFKRVSLYLSINLMSTLFTIVRNVLDTAHLLSPSSQLQGREYKNLRTVVDCKSEFSYLSSIHPSVTTPSVQHTQKWLFTYKRGSKWLTFCTHHSLLFTFHMKSCFVICTKDERGSVIPQKLRDKIYRIRELNFSLSIQISL